MTTRDVAKMKGVSVDSVLRGIRNGDLPAVMEGRAYEIDVDDAKGWGPRPAHRPQDGRDWWYTGLRLPTEWRASATLLSSQDETVTEVLRRLLEPHLSPF